MTKDDIFRMLGEAGMYLSNDVNHIGRVWCSDEYPIDEELFRFADLVAAHEREQCAQVCESGVVETSEWDASYWNRACEDAAFRIRARGEK